MPQIEQYDKALAFPAKEAENSEPQENAANKTLQLKNKGLRLRSHMQLFYPSVVSFWLDKTMSF